MHTLELGGFDSFSFKVSKLLVKRILFSYVISVDLSFYLKFQGLQVGHSKVLRYWQNLNKAAIVSSESKERLNILGGLWHWPYHLYI